MQDEAGRHEYSETFDKKFDSEENCRQHKSTARIKVKKLQKMRTGLSC